MCVCVCECQFYMTQEPRICKLYDAILGRGKENTLYCIVRKHLAVSDIICAAGFVIRLHLFKFNARWELKRSVYGFLMNFFFHFLCMTSIACYSCINRMHNNRTDRDQWLESGIRSSVCVCVCVCLHMRRRCDGFYGRLDHLMAIRVQKTHSTNIRHKMKRKEHNKSIGSYANASSK